jgi:hypothetical protein
MKLPVLRRPAVVLAGAAATVAAGLVLAPSASASPDGLHTKGPAATAAPAGLHTKGGGTATVVPAGLHTKGGGSSATVVPAGLHTKGAAAASSCTEACQVGETGWFGCYKSGDLVGSVKYGTVTNLNNGKRQIAYVKWNWMAFPVTYIAVTESGITSVGHDPGHVTGSEGTADLPFEPQPRSVVTYLAGVLGKDHCETNFRRYTPTRAA